MASPLAREALRLNPEEKEAHNAVFEAEKGVFQDWYCANHHKLIDFYKGVVAVHPDDRRNYYWLLDLLIADSRTEEARLYAQRMKAVEHSVTVIPMMRDGIIIVAVMAGVMPYLA